MDLKITLKNQYCADGTYTLRAPGCMLASLYWANDQGPLENYTAFGILPLAASNGTGSFLFTGGRAIPREATAVFVRAVSGDLQSTQEGLFPLAGEVQTKDQEAILFRGIAVSDLHLVRKTGTLRRALKSMADAGCLLLAGDLTNNGKEEEFAALSQCLAQQIPQKPVFCVNGNHDLFSGPDAYFAFQNAQRDKAVKLGVSWEDQPEGVYTARMGAVEIIGISAGKPWKELQPVSREQLQWLDKHLENSGAKWHIVLLHAPLRRGLPGRGSYLTREEQLEKVLNRHHHVLLLSGHTHLSPNLADGTVFEDRQNHNYYINCGSIRPTELGKENVLAPSEWVDGNTVELSLTAHSLSIRMWAVHQNKWIARGNYDFDTSEGFENGEHDQKL